MNDERKQYWKAGRREFGSAAPRGTRIEASQMKTKFRAPRFVACQVAKNALHHVPTQLFSQLMIHKQKHSNFKPGFKSEKKNSKSKFEKAYFLGCEKNECDSRVQRRGEKTSSSMELQFESYSSSTSSSINVRSESIFSPFHSERRREIVPTQSEPQYELKKRKKKSITIKKFQPFARSEVGSYMLLLWLPSQLQYTLASTFPVEKNEKRQF